MSTYLYEGLVGNIQNIKYATDKRLNQLLR